MAVATRKWDIAPWCLCRVALPVSAVPLRAPATHPHGELQPSCAQSQRHGPGTREMAWLLCTMPALQRRCPARGQQRPHAALGPSLWGRDGCRGEGRSPQPPSAWAQQPDPLCLHWAPHRERLPYGRPPRAPARGHSPLPSPSLTCPPPLAPRGPLSHAAPDALWVPLFFLPVEGTMASGWLWSWWGTGARASFMGKLGNAVQGVSMP